MENNYFQVIGVDDQVFDFSLLNLTIHFSHDRMSRHNAILNLIGSGKQLYSFVVDKRHPNGDEIHSIFDNGVIVVRNQRTGRLVTEMVARPPQIARYWYSLNKPLPIEILVTIDRARHNQEMGYNYL